MAIAAIFKSVISLAVYLRILVPIYAKEKQKEKEKSSSISVVGKIYVLVTVIEGIGVHGLICNYGEDCKGRIKR